MQCNEYALPAVLKRAPGAGAGAGAQAHAHALPVAAGLVGGVFVAVALVAMHGLFGLVDEARRRPKSRTTGAGTLFEVSREMAWSGVRPNEFGFSCTVNACTGSRDLEARRQVHAMVVM
ncbi:hypothetical protein ACP70R_002186 [Stipagrostis hirtigluma subsp. patula]